MKSKREIFDRELRRNKFRVTVFGSARIKKGNPNYWQLFTLGELLGKRGIDVVTGGGPGTMEAVSRGHKIKKNGKDVHTIGLGIELPKIQKFNKSVDIRREFKRFSSRLDHFMLLSNAIIIAPGGIGTLLEFFYAWQLVQVKHICHIPIILMGKQWFKLIDWVKKDVLGRKFIDKEDLNLLFLANTPKEAVEIVEMAREEYNQGNKNFCLNYKKYRLD